jgi:hypothetical protein
MVEEKEMDLIERANAAAERIERANEQYKELVKRSEQIESMRVLGGRTAAGAPAEPPMSEEEKIRLGAKAYFKGGVLEKVFK